MRLPERVRGCLRTFANAADGDASAVLDISQTARPRDATRLEVLACEFERMAGEREPGDFELAERRRATDQPDGWLASSTGAHGAGASTSTSSPALPSRASTALSSGSECEQLVSAWWAVFFGHTQAVERAHTDQALGLRCARRGCGAGSRRDRGRAAPPARRRSPRCPWQRGRGHREGPRGSQRPRPRRCTRLLDSFTCGARIAMPCAPSVVDDVTRAVEAHRLVVEDRSGELGRVVGLEPCARVADDGEARRVRLVEAVGGKPFELAEDLLGHAELDTATESALDEVALDALHLGSAASFGHRAAQRVGLGEIEAGDGTRDEQDLLLVDDDAVGVRRAPRACRDAARRRARCRDGGG